MDLNNLSYMYKGMLENKENEEQVRAVIEALIRKGEYDEEF